MGTDQQPPSRGHREVLWDMLQMLAYSDGQWRKKPLTAFAGLGEFGDSRGLMIIGRAVNGWRDEGWYADDLEDLEKRSKILEDAYAPTQWQNGHPMRWVSHNWGSRVRYNTQKFEHQLDPDSILPRQNGGVRPTPPYFTFLVVIKKSPCYYRVTE